MRSDDFLRGCYAYSRKLASDTVPVYSREGITCCPTPIDPGQYSQEASARALRFGDYKLDVSLSDFDLDLEVRRTARKRRGRMSTLPWHYLYENVIFEPLDSYDRRSEVGLGTETILSALLTAASIPSPPPEKNLDLCRLWWLEGLFPIDLREGKHAVAKVRVNQDSLSSPPAALCWALTGLYGGIVRDCSHLGQQLAWRTTDVSHEPDAPHQFDVDMPTASLDYGHRGNNVPDQACAMLAETGGVLFADPIDPLEKLVRSFEFAGTLMRATNDETCSGAFWGIIRSLMSGTIPVGSSKAEQLLYTIRPTWHSGDA